MPTARVRTIARALLGFGAGLLLWWGLTPAYGRLVASFAEPLIRLSERPRATRLYPEERRIVIERADFPSDSDRPSLPADDLTFNVALLFALAATVPGLLRDRGIAQLALCLAILFSTHVLALVVNVEALYAMQLGAWSGAHYGRFARNSWTTAAHFYRLVAVFAIPVVLWWGLLLAPAEETSSARRRKKKKKKG